MDIQHLDLALSRVWLQHCSFRLAALAWQAEFKVGENLKTVVINIL